MVPYLGDFSEDATVYIPFNTFSSDDPSASVTITNLADADIMVHKDAGLTQIATDGATVSIDFDSITGNHIVTIDTSASADYSTGSDYLVRMEGTTVDGATINAWIGQFSIENRHSAGALRPTTAGRTLDVTATGAAGIDWGNVENTTTAVDLSGTDIQLCDTITTYTGNTVQTGDAFARLGAPAGASVSADIATVDGNVDAVLVDTGTDIPARFDGIEGATFSTGTDSLEAIRNRGDAAWTTGAGGSAPDVLQNTTIATLASQTSFTLTAGSADNDAYNDCMIVIEDSATSTQKAVGRISDYVGSTRTVTLLTDPGIFTMAVGDTVDVIANLSSADVQYWNGTEVTTALETSADMADAVWDEAMSGHTTAGTAGDALGVDVPAILLDTNELQTDWANGGRLDLILDSRMAEASIDTTAGAVDNVTLVATTTTNTDMRGTDSAALASVATEARLAELDAANLPTDIANLNDVSAADVNAQCDIAISDAALATAANLATAQTDLDTITGSDGVTLATAQGNYAPSTAAALATVDGIVDNLNLGIIYGTAQTGTLTTTACTTDLTGYADDDLINRSIVFTGGTADGCGAEITDYASASGLVSFSGGIATAPANGDTFKIV